MTSITPVWGLEAELLTLVQALDFLKDRVDGFQDTAFHFLELAKPYGVVDAVVLEEVSIFRSLEGPRSYHRVAVHVGDAAVHCLIVEVRRPET
jgi:hypothetical protein